MGALGFDGDEGIHPKSELSSEFLQQVCKFRNPSSIKLMGKMGALGFDGDEGIHPFETLAA